MLAAQPSIQAASHEHDIQMWLMKRAKEQGIDITPPKDPGPKATPAMKEAYEAALDAHEEKLMALQTHAAIPESQVGWSAGCAYAIRRARCLRFHRQPRHQGSAGGKTN